MNTSYVGQYSDTNTSVVEYYNFARTGFDTQQMLTAGTDEKDACDNKWGRGSPPVTLADTAIRKAKTDERKAYFVTTGGVNNTNWTKVAEGIAKCGVVDEFRRHIQKYIVDKKLPWTATLHWFDADGKEIAKGKAILGGACHGKVKGDLTDVTYIHKRIEIPTYDGPDKYKQIGTDAKDIVNKMLTAGADKIVWMGYYDLTPAKINVGNFAETYRLKLSEKVQGWLPGKIPSYEVELVSDDDWKKTAKKWIGELNAAVKDNLPANAKVKFQAAPELDADKIQKTMVGGCPHPNKPGHAELAKTLDTAFKAI